MIGMGMAGLAGSARRRAAASTPTATAIVAPNTFSGTFTRASSASYVTSTGVLTTAGSNVARFIGASQRLMVEGQRTVSIRNSASITNGSGWQYVNMISTGTTAGPSASGTATVFQADANNAPHQLICNATVALTAGLYYTISAIAKAGASQFVQMASANANFLANFWANFDLINGVVGSTGGGMTASILPLGDGWFRCEGSAVCASTNNTTLPIILQIASSASSARNPVFAGSASYSISIASAQIEQGAPSSTTIPTTTAAVTRAADVPSLPLAATAGTLVGAFMVPSVNFGNETGGLFVLHDGTDNNRFGLRKAATGSTIVPVRAISGTETAGTSLGAIAANTPFKAALAWDASGLAACLNGGAVQTIAGANPAITTLLLGHGSADLTRAMFGQIGALDFYASRQSDVQLQSLTT